MDFLFGFNKPTPQDEFTSILTTVHDPIELSIVRSILDGEKIPYRVCERGSGGMVKVIAGYSTFGTDIMVPAETLAMAQELLDAYRNGDVVEDELLEADGEDGEEA